MKLPAWLQRAWQAPPRTYRPGQTLALLAHDLPGLQAQRLTATHWQFGKEKASWQFAVHECVQRQFLLHIVTCRFVMPVVDSPSGQARVLLTHDGFWRRTRLRWKVVVGNPSALQPLLLRLNADVPLHAALMALDFQCFALIQNEKGWRVEVEPYAASEVVVRLPAMRRYIRLPYQQAQHLLNALARLQGKLREPK